MIGAMLSHYRIIRQLGKGGMGKKTSMKDEV